MSAVTHVHIYDRFMLALLAITGALSIPILTGQVHRRGFITASGNGTNTSRHSKRFYSNQVLWLNLETYPLRRSKEIEMKVPKEGVSL